jgi:hypothetical protein
MTAQVQPPAETPAAHPDRATRESLDLIRTNIPSERHCLARGVCWGGTSKADGRFDKTPISPIHRQPTARLGRIAHTVEEAIAWWTPALSSTPPANDVEWEAP